MTAVVGKASLDQIVANSNKLVFVDFWAERCGPCRMLGPVLEQLAVKYPEKVEIVKIDVDEDDNQELAIMYGVRSIPQVNIFKNGEEIDKFVGALPPEQIEEFITKHTN